MKKISMKKKLAGTAAILILASALLLSGCGKTSGIAAVTSSQTASVSGASGSAGAASSAASNASAVTLTSLSEAANDLFSSRDLAVQGQGKGATARLGNLVFSQSKQISDAVTSPLFPWSLF